MTPPFTWTRNEEVDPKFHSVPICCTIHRLSSPLEKDVLSATCLIQNVNRRYDRVFTSPILLRIQEGPGLIPGSGYVQSWESTRTVY